MHSICLQVADLQDASMSFWVCNHAYAFRHPNHCLAAHVTLVVIIVVIIVTLASHAHSDMHVQVADHVG